MNYKNIFYIVICLLLFNCNQTTEHNSNKMYGPDSQISNTHKKILKFLDTQDLKVLFSHLR